MQTVAVIAQKGGAGKTTLSIAVACAALERRRTPAVVDLDPQATAASWSDRRASSGPVVLPAQPPRLPRILEAAAAEGIDFAVPDTAPRANESGLAAAEAADLVLVPCRPTVVDLETLQTTMTLVRAANPRVPILCVLNAVPPRGSAERQARDLLEHLRIPVAAAALGHRVAFPHAFTRGLSPTEYEPRGRAAAEIRALYREVDAALAATR